MRLVFSVVLLSAPTHLSAQQQETFDMVYQVIYKLTYQPDSNDTGDKRNKLMELLWDGESTSLFRSQERGANDSMAYHETRITMPLPTVTRIGDVDKLNYQIKKSNDRIVTFDALTGRSNDEELSFYYEESPGRFNWSMKEDTCTIGGILCQKAVSQFGGRHWVAWFAPDIPLSSGPYSFCGLPGLILKITDTRNHWDFEAIDIQNVKRTVVINFRANIVFRPIDKFDFFKKRRHYQKQAVAQGERASKSALEERLEKDNNWIERYL